MSDPQALRRRLEGALELVESSAAELERVTARLRKGHMVGLQRAVELRRDDALDKARAGVARLAAGEPSLAVLLRRLDEAHAALDAAVHRRADALGLAQGPAEARARLLETSRVLFRGSGFPQRWFAAFSAVVVGLGVVIASRKLHLGGPFRPLLLLGMGWVGVQAIATLVARWFFAPKLVVTTASVRVGSELIHPDELAHVEVETRRQRRRSRTYRVTLVEKSGVPRKPVTLPSVPEDFTLALRLLGIRVRWDEVSRR